MKFRNYREEILELLKKLSVSAAATCVFVALLHFI